MTGAAGGAHVTQGATGVGAPGPGVQAGWTGAGAAARALVVKLGGRALDAPGSLAQCAAELQQAAGHGPAAHVHGAARRALVVVHGGGAEVTAWCARAGIEARFAGGLRLTDRPTLEIAAAVLAGLANKRLVAALRARGLDAVGLSALDGGIARVRRHRDAEVLGEVGEVASVDASLLVQLLAAGRTPVLASLGDDGHGALLNLNADDVAAAVAAALPAADLVLLSDTAGLRLAGGRVDSLDLAALARALGHPDVTGGMLPKLRAAQAALAGGVRRVHIAAWQGAGTLAAILDGTAVATTCHAGPIHDTETEESHA